jgi:hypothetical protein
MASIFESLDGPEKNGLAGIGFELHFHNFLNRPDCDEFNASARHG